MSALYDPLIERDFEGFRRAADEFLASHGPAELWTAVARFAVLAYAPSQHGKRAVMAVRAAHQLRDAMGGRWTELVLECARYAADARQPWSEPPLLEPPPVDSDAPRDREALRDAIAAKNRARAEQWLAARVDDAGDDLLAVARGDALLVTDAVLALAPLLGEKGRYALLRVALWEMLADNEDERTASRDAAIERAVASRGSVDAVRQVLLASVGFRGTARPLEPYRLARDYAQTLLCHAAGVPEPLLAAVRENLAHGESFEEWSHA